MRSVRKIDGVPQSDSTGCIWKDRRRRDAGARLLDRAESENRSPLTSTLTLSKLALMSRTDHPLPTLSAKERIVLDLLAVEGQMYGLQLVTQSGGRLKRGTVYVTLGRMQQKGLIDADAEKLSDDSGLVPRRMYRATPFGLRVLQAWTHAARMLAVGEARS